jgi:hypothetical protein
MTSVITGDIIHSSSLPDQRQWLDPVKALFDTIGPRPCVWDIYRGDSFQIEITDPTLALHTALRIKARVKTIGKIDARMAIGIGEKTHTANRISESNGPAFVHSGQSFETLSEKEVDLAIASPWEDFDASFNLYFKLANAIIADWKAKSAEVAFFSLENPQLTQAETGAALGITQSSVSERVARAHLSELLELDAHYRHRLTRLLNKSST